MGRFEEIAKRLADIASDGGITVSQLGERIHPLSNQLHGQSINCYPGLPSDRCHSFALFVSLNGALRQGQGWYSFPKILEALVQHFQGKCPRKTTEGVVITDTWDSWAYEKWQSNIEEIRQSGVYLEFYLVGTHGWVTEIPC